ncbi:MAG: translation initiation factor IF-6 [Thaumarchaeota archaeon]|jgi:translation initiation factor 6|nr:translation initiation factor IF-6 [Candidatus Geocrenenecus arthurdayi]
MKAGKQELIGRGIYVEEFFGTVEVGLFATATDRVCIVPPQIKPRHQKLIEKALETDIIKTTIAGSFLIGPLVAGNSNGLVVSCMVLDEELEKIKSSIRDSNILVLESRYTATGNLILANDRAALVSSYFNKREVKLIQDTLGVEVIQGMIANRPYVGSIAVVTNNGGIIHVQASREEEEKLSEFFKVEFIPGTVNDGVPFIRSGIIANSKGAIVGARTTGPELMTISRALKV